MISAARLLAFPPPLNEKLNLLGIAECPTKHYFLTNGELGESVSENKIKEVTGELFVTHPISMIFMLFPPTFFLPEFAQEVLDRVLTSKP